MEEKINSLIAQMTLEEKVSLLAGANMWRSVTIDRLGIPAVQVTDGPNGARGMDDNLGATSVCFPVGIAMGATWNPPLIEQVGAVLAREARAKGASVLLAPTVNIHRTPLAGRNFECYAEDPYLSGTIASAYINGLQGQGVSACIKHFVCNDQEFERFSISSEITERPLHEIYLEPFRIALQNANPWTVMSAYNRINGLYASENPLLVDILKGRWGYDGLVMSDWYGTYSENVPAGGLDLEMPGTARWMNPEKIIAAVRAGEMAESHVDDKVSRLLRLMERVGAFDGDAPAVPIDTPTDRQLTRTVAQEAIVLLKNEGELLPLDADKLQKVAVIGQNGRWAQIMGGGSSAVNPHYAISPLQGISERIGRDGVVAYEIGTPIFNLPMPVEVAWLTAEDGRSNGLTLRYFNNLELSGEPSHTAVLKKSYLSWFGEANPLVDPAHFSLRLTGTLTAPADGDYELHLWSIGRARLELDDKVLIDHWQADGVHDRRNTVTVPLRGGQPVSLMIEYVTQPDTRWRTVRLGCTPPLPADPIQAAVDLAAQADVAIVVAGLTHEWESEGFDRLDMNLVGRQNELISRVAAANPRTIVVLNVGSAVVMPWLDSVAAVLQQWYGGQEAGHALADVLFGDVNPSGHLPTTFPRRLQDNPAYLNYPGENGQVHYGEGLFVGYRYYDKKEIEPLFPFGHGLSYTTFAYDNLRVSQSGDEIQVEVDVTNSGRHAGQEVVQLYVRDVATRLVRPEKELKAFAKVALQPSEQQTISLRLNRQSLSFYDPAVAGWVAEDGDFELLVGRSSRDIRLRTTFNWQGNSQGRRLHTGLPISALLADSRGKRVLEEQLGELLNHPQANMAMEMSLDQISGFVPGLLTAEKLAAINAALAGS
jgi:beta-glucosidase